MNFKPTAIKTLLAFTVGLMSAFYFRDSCTACQPSDLNFEMFIGFIPAFLWVYGLISLVQYDEVHSRFWHYLIVVPFVIIMPLIIGTYLQKIFNL